MKRRRLTGKQPPPPRYSESGEAEEESAGPFFAESGEAEEQSPLPCFAESREAEEQSAEHDEACEERSAGLHGDELQDAHLGHRWPLLGKYKTVHGLVAAVIREKTDDQLHSISINTLLEDILAKAGGKVTMTELLQQKDDFVSASMAVVPKELSRRLLLAVSKPPPDAGMPERIDSQCVQKTYLLTFSNLDPGNAPTRETILQIVLKAYEAADYGGSVLTHAGVFREWHRNGQCHFHVATALSEPCRWAGWKREIQKLGYVVHFSNMAIENHSKHRKMQYSHMLRYLWLPSPKKALSELDKDPLLWCHGGRKHPALVDAINGTLDSASIEEKVADNFLQRYAAGKRGPCKFSEIELWPIVSQLRLQPDDPILLPKLLQHARDTNNERLLTYLFRNSGNIRQKVEVCCALETCDRVVTEAKTTAWKRFTSSLEQPCCCDRTWAAAAREIVANNGLNEAELCKRVRCTLFSGLQKKGDAIGFTGSGNEGKSFLLKPLSLVYPRVPRMFTLARVDFFLGSGDSQ